MILIALISKRSFVLLKSKLLNIFWANELVVKHTPHKIDGGQGHLNPKKRELKIIIRK